MIKKFRVFDEGEKKNLVKKLMIVHFLEFEKVDLPIKNLPYIYLGKEKQKFVIDYSNDQFTYYGKIPEKDIWSFKDPYENAMARELKVVIGSEIKDNDLFSKLNPSKI